jgi:hypothetical protein
MYDVRTEVDTDAGNGVSQSTNEESIRALATVLYVPTYGCA